MLNFPFFCNKDVALYLDIKKVLKFTSIKKIYAINQQRFLRSVVNMVKRYTMKPTVK